MAFTQYIITGPNGITTTTLGGCAQYDRPENLRHLLAQGASVDETNEEGCSALYMAAACGHLDVCCLLLEHGANVDQADIDGITPLWTASRHGHLKVVRFLVEHGADRNHRSNGGFTPLEAAEHEQHLDVVQLLKHANTPVCKSKGKAKREWWRFWRA